MTSFLKYVMLASALGFSYYSIAQGTTDPPTSGGSSQSVNTTWRPSLVRDGVISRPEHITKAMDWQDIRENDVAWAQRVWREIDVRTKQNQAFIYEGDEFSGGGAFVEILNHLIDKGKVQAYSGLDDKFSSPLDKEAFKKAIGGGIDTITQEDPITGETTIIYRNREFNVASVTKFRVKEDWVFDRNLGRLVVRILGIAPLADRVDDNGEYRGSVEMYWIYYPEARKELVNYEVYNPVNMVRRMTWTDYLDNRQFGSTIIKTNINNPIGRRLPDNIQGMYQGQMMLEDIVNRESDMWER